MNQLAMRASTAEPTLAKWAATDGAADVALDHQSGAPAPVHRPAPLASNRSWEDAFPPDLLPIIAACLRRLSSWRLPPNWSAIDWREEVREIFRVAAWEAEADFDPTRGVPFPCFLSRRVISRVLTRYRQEWSYGLHFHSPCSGNSLASYENDPRPRTSPDSELPDIADPASADEEPEDREALAEALATLPEPSRRLIRLLFWEGRTECEAAMEFGVAQPAISKRKHAILQTLRHRVAH